MIKDVPLVNFFRYQNNSIDEEELLALNWELLIRQARRANLLACVASLLDEKQLLQKLPPKPRFHFEGALLVHKANNRSVKWEVKKLHQALFAGKIDFILLKGAAYVLNEVSASKGRLFADIDILIRKDQLTKTELILIQNGWMASNIDSYDEKYYRKWMHELPPMKHLKRQTTLDVHHTIIPPTAMLNIDTEKLWLNSCELPGYKGVGILSLADMILHSAAHLFYEGEFDNGLRDINDLDALFKQYRIGENRSWEKLIYRGRELNLIKPLNYAMRYCAIILNTPIPNHVISNLSVEVMTSVTQKIMDFLFLRALMPNHFTCDDYWTSVARWLLYIRSHWLKMPWYLLIPHLSRKACMRLVDQKQ